MTVDRGEFDAYSRALSENVELAKAEMRKLIGWARKMAGMSDEELLDFVVNSYSALVAKYGDQAASVALEFYDQQRKAAGIMTDYDITISDGHDAALTRADVQVAFDEHKDAGTGDDELASRVAGMAARRVMQRADSTIIGNAARDPAKPKWAFVPHAGACGWCILLGSRGFEYTSDATAKVSRHHGCSCSVCVDFSSNPSLDGYDDAKLREIYYKAVNSADKPGHGAIVAEINKMTGYKPSGDAE